MQRFSLYNFSAFYSVLVFLLFSVGLFGCTDDFGEPCAFPPIGECTASGNGPTTATCVFTNSAQCSSRVCSIYDGSEGFCSELCENDDDCPSKSTCMHVPANDSICVPNNLLD